MSFSINRLKIYLRNHVLPAFLFQWRARFYKTPDAHLYRPMFQPWRDKKSLFLKYFREISSNTLITNEGVWILYNLAKQALTIRGDFIEVGVYRGGSARLFWRLCEGHPKTNLYLFDTFSGMPPTNKKKDLHREKDFLDTSLEQVSAFVGNDERIHYIQGFIPDSFKNLPSDIQFSFAHIDLDIYESILNACQFLYPKMSPGGFIVFDDYGAPSCPGARLAVDQFFSDKPEVPLLLPTGQAIVYIMEKG